jgi:hypothetical protein
VMTDSTFVHKATNATPLSSPESLAIPVSGPAPPAVALPGLGQCTTTQHDTVNQIDNRVQTAIRKGRLHLLQLKTRCPPKPNTHHAYHNVVGHDQVTQTPMVARYIAPQGRLVSISPDRLDLRLPTSYENHVRWHLLLRDCITRLNDTVDDAVDDTSLDNGSDTSSQEVGNRLYERKSLWNQISIALETQRRGFGDSNVFVRANTDSVYEWTQFERLCGHQNKVWHAISSNEVRQFRYETEYDERIVEYEHFNYPHKPTLVRRMVSMCLIDGLWIACRLPLALYELTLGYLVEFLLYDSV